MEREMSTLMEVNIRVGTRAVNDPSVFIITGKAPTRAFSWLKVPI